MNGSRREKQRRVLLIRRTCVCYTCYVACLFYIPRRASSEAAKTRSPFNPPERPYAWGYSRSASCAASAPESKFTVRTVRLLPHSDRALPGVAWTDAARPWRKAEHTRRDEPS